MNFTTKALLILSTLIASPLATFFPANAANLVQNGDFEKGVSQNNWLLQGNTGIVTDTAYQELGATGQLPSGHYFIAFNGGNKQHNGTISQTIPTILGQKYILSFLYGNSKFSTQVGTQSLRVNVIDSTKAFGTLVGVLIINPNGSSNLSTLFNFYSLSFIATSQFTKIEFADYSPNTISADGFLDNITVIPAP